MTVIRMELSFLNLCSPTFSRPLRTYSLLSQACSQWKINNIHQKLVLINKASDWFELSSMDGETVLFFLLFTYNGDVYSAHAFHLQRDANMIRNFASYAACNYPESHWFTSASPDSPQIVYRYRNPGFDWILVVQTRLYYISYGSPIYSLCASSCCSVRFARR